MVLDTRVILELIRDNMRVRGLPLPVPEDVLSKWTHGLSIPRDGEYLLFTGGLYQLLPYIEALVGQLEKLEKGVIGGLALKLAKRVAKISELAKFVAKPDKRMEEFSTKVLQSIVVLLEAAGVDFYYRPELDGYSGALLYDLGLDKSFQQHALKLYERLREVGVQKIVTVDPHTTHMLRNVYPRYVGGYSIEVKSYLELLYENLAKLEFQNASGPEVVIHDPCLYARFEDILEPPRRLLEAAGYRVVEPRRSGRLTYCCGGPIEAVAPRLSKRIAENRVEELSSYSTIIVTLCPICYANLSRVAPDNTRVEDISILLAERLVSRAG
ncbi:(Fe-S)-binding protein [Hyperthermus butylicus]|uniref:Fe-S oxidoreductase n=1 Tax=Hyperthermus butylicus (strain DSM 5456 / JCM 9403 / PLM1-5) TaxID=415426 RepID=A2BLD5_HYPBU|nr:(Fe-S)-binding protein [Hyperthermus butylicus]ABM80796.1 putative Fe-S oxidoreductase [Hyperthermus butylicus DSM 5456]